MRITTTPEIIKLAAIDGISVNKEIEIAIGLYCTIRSLTIEQQADIHTYIQEAEDGNSSTRPHH